VGPLPGRLDVCTLAGKVKVLAALASALALAGYGAVIAAPSAGAHQAPAAKKARCKKPHRAGPRKRRKCRKHPKTVFPTQAPVPPPVPTPPPLNERPLPPEPPPIETESDFTPATIYEIAKGEVADEAKAHLSHALVTAVASDGKTAWVGMEPTDVDYEGPSYSGLQIDLSAISPTPLAVGDRVAIDGSVVKAQTGNWIAAAAVAVESSGEPVAPLEVSAESLTAAGQMEPLDAVLVEVPTQTLEEDTGAEWAMSGGFVVAGDIMGELPEGAFLEGTVFAWLAGVADTLGSGPRLLPRGIEDFGLSP